MPDRQETLDFLSDTGRVLVLYDFWIDCQSKCALISAILVDACRSGASVAAPVLLTRAVGAILNDPPLGEDAKKLILGWAGALALERVFKAINDVIIAHIQTKLSNQLIGKKMLKKLHAVNFAEFKTKFRDVHVADASIKFTEETGQLLKKSIHEFFPLFFNLMGSALVLKLLPSDLSTEISNVATGILWTYSIYNFAASIGCSYYSRNANAKTEEKAGCFKRVLDEDIANMETIRLYNRSPLHLKDARKLYRNFSENILANDAYPALLKLFLIKIVFGLVVLLTIQLIAGSSLNKKSLDELVLVINYLLLFHASTETFGATITDTRDAIRHVKQIKSQVANAPYANEHTSSAYWQVAPHANAGAAHAGQAQEGLQALLPNAVAAQQVVIDIADPAAGVAALPQPDPTAIIEFIGVTYNGPQNPILSNISFKILPGKSCALVGDSGSGKSTIIALLCGLIEPSSGHIFFGAANIAQMPKDTLRAQMTIISQEPQLFKKVGNAAARLKYNTLFGDLPAERLESLKTSAQSVQLQVNETTLFERKKTAFLLNNVQDNLVQPSGGEKQRIAFARGMRARTLMVLDEPTSAVDAQTENSIITNFNAYMRNQPAIRALLVTGHRLKTVQECDEVIVLRQGQIVERGALVGIARPEYQQYNQAQEGTPSFEFTPG